MNYKKFVRISNFLGLISIIFLLYWVFISVTINVFGLKIFKENITQTFEMSVLGILALMAGALMVNIMFNLTRIAEKHNTESSTEQKAIPQKLIWIFIISFPVILGLLFFGDYRTTQKKKELMIQSAISVTTSNLIYIEKICNYNFSKEWIDSTSNYLRLMSQIDTYFPNIELIIPDAIENSKIFLSFNSYYRSDTSLPQKKSYIRSTTLNERKYLDNIFNNNYNEVRFSSHDGSYELFYPFSKNNHKVVLYFSDRQRYGKIGS